MQKSSPLVQPPTSEGAKDVRGTSSRIQEVEHETYGVDGSSHKDKTDLSSASSSSIKSQHHQNQNESSSTSSPQNVKHSSKAKGSDDEHREGGSRRKISQNRSEHVIDENKEDSRIKVFVQNCIMIYVSFVIGNIVKKTVGGKMGVLLGDVIHTAAWVYVPNRKFINGFLWK